MKLKLRPRLIGVGVKRFLFREQNRVRIWITYGHHIINVNRDKYQQAACHSRALSLKVFIFLYLTNLCSRLSRIIKKLQTKRQGEPGETSEETSGCVRTGKVNKWHNSTTTR